MNQNLVIIKGAGDIATGVAHRLHRCGYRLVLLDLAQPTAIRRTVSFCQAIYDGHITVEGVTAERTDLESLAGVWVAGRIPVLPGVPAERLDDFLPAALVEATLSKQNTGLNRRPGRVTLALGPGYLAGVDADGVVETARGHYLGRLILEGAAKPNTGKPGIIGGYDLERLVRSPGAGEVRFLAAIGEAVQAGQTIAQVGAHPVIAAIDGILRGALADGLQVPQGFKIGDIDPRPEAADFIHTPSDKARAVAGGVLEGLLYFGAKP